MLFLIEKKASHQDQYESKTIYQQNHLLMINDFVNICFSPDLFGYIDTVTAKIDSREGKKRTLENHQDLR